jgi:hypothetical protein
VGGRLTHGERVTALDDVKTAQAELHASAYWKPRSAGFSATHLYKCDAALQAAIRDLAAPVPAPAPVPTPSPASGPFAPGCWLYQDARTASKLAWSDAFIQKLLAATNGFNINQGGWAPPIYKNSAATAPVSLAGANGWHIDSAPIDPSKKSSPDSDRWLVHITPDGARSYEFVANGVTHDLTQPYEAGVIYDLVNGHGVAGAGQPSCGHGGSNISLLAGVIRPAELARAVAAYKAGDIANADLGHALTCAIPGSCTRANGWFGLPQVPGAVVFPAAASDGRCPDTSGAPMGTRFRVNAAFDVTQLPMVEHRVIVLTMQRRGVYSCDSTGDVVALYTENTVTAGSVYPANLSPLPKSVLAAFEAVASPPVGVYDTAAHFGGQPHQ